MLFTKKGTSIHIEPTLRVKIKEVEDFYKPYFTRDFEYFESIKTIGNNLFKIKKYYDQGLTADPDEHSYYLVENLNDINPTATGLVNLIRDYGYRYFNQTADIGMVDRFLNSKPREISIHHSLYPMRAIIGAIVAYKSKNPNLKALIEVYREELVDAETQYKMEFENIIREM